MNVGLGGRRPRFEPMPAAAQPFQRRRELRPTPRRGSAARRTRCASSACPKPSSAAIRSPGPGLPSAAQARSPATSSRSCGAPTTSNVYIEEIRRAGLYDEIWQAFAVLLPVRTVGVMVDRSRRYPDIADVLAQKAEGRRQRAALGFAEKLAGLDALRERVAPIVRARESRRERETSATRIRSAVSTTFKL